MVRLHSRMGTGLLALVTLVSLATTASATRYNQVVHLTEAEEVPTPPAPNGGTADGFININTTTNTITYDIIANGLNGSVTAAHIHGYAGPGQAAGVKIGFTQTSPGVFTGTATYPDSMEANLLSGATYVNVHTTLNPAGQVRKQLNAYVQQSDNLVPGVTPVGLGLLGLALLGGGAIFVWRRRNTTA